MSDYKFKRIGDEHQDCTSHYEVVLLKEFTLKEFTQQVIIDSKDKWGSLKLKGDNTFNKEFCKYKYLEGDYTFPDGKENLKVVSVKAHGGWSNMDYTLEVEVL